MIKSKLLDFPNPDISEDFIYQFPSQNKDSKCYLRFYRGQDKQIVILTELKDNPGASITNSAEYLYDQLKDFLLKKYNIELGEDAILIEHYEADHYGEGEDERFALFNKSGNFQHLSRERLELIFSENYSRNWDVIALLDSWASEEADEQEQKETWEFLERNLRHSPFIEPKIELWTIYHNLPAYPNKFVALKFITSSRTDELIVEDNLEDIRSIFESEGRRRIEPQPEQESTIVEIWI